jgi:hypothetical protein
VGGGQGEIKAVKAGEHKAHNEHRGAQENSGCATQEMGAAEGEESQLAGQHSAIGILP